jgi:DNA-binding SARP family transcriptional activator
MFKGFRLTADGIGVPLTTAAQRLLAYLALQQRPLPRTLVAGVLWADVPDDRAGGNLRSALWRLRQPGLRLVDSDGSCLSLSPLVSVDVRDADAIAARLLNPTEEASDVDLEEFAFGGDLLPGWYEDWAILERERQRLICLHALETLCERWAASGQFAKAVLAGLAAVSSEPLRESASRALIKAHLAEGNGIEARRQYGVYRLTLRRELDLEPSSEIKQLVAHLHVS